MTSNQEPAGCTISAPIATSLIEPAALTVEMKVRKNADGNWNL